MVKIGGVVVPAWTSWSVDSNSFFSADTFHVTFAASALPASQSADWFSRQKTLEVEILAGFPKDPANPQDSEMHSLIVGHVDDVTFNPATAELELTGRDLSAQLIDNKTSPEAFRNQTSSQVAEALAKKYGLTAKITPTKTKVGTYYDADHVGISDQRSEWDVLTYLASQEGFVALMKGRTLVFAPSPFTEPPKDHYVIDWYRSAGMSHLNGKNLSFTRSLTIAKGVTVTASSYQTKHKKQVSASYPSGARSVGADRATAVGGTTQNYKLRLPPNKSVLEVQAAAKKRYVEITQHEMKLTLDGPADHSLDIQTAIKVQGTNTAFDQVYYPDAIVWNMNMDSGYTMNLRAKNLAPENTPNL
jgi:phage protein D